MCSFVALSALLAYVLWKKCCTKSLTNTDHPFPSSPPATAPTAPVILPQVVQPLAQPAMYPSAPNLATVTGPPPTAINFKKSPP